jgi:histidyl-tRNA synthetase
MSGNDINKEVVAPSILPGFIELLPKEQITFNKMMDTIRKTYELYGFIPIDTPVIEKSEVLLAKSGGDTAKQVYRFTKGDSDLSLRFDLTVPLARFVAQHYNELTFPFRRYHIGRVYRGERPQKGRFREFYQCDIDIIGNEKLSIINDAEILSVIYSTFKALELGDFTIRLNNRKVLNGLFEELGIDNKVDVMRIIDKIDKIGQDALKEELADFGLNAGSVEKLMDFITTKGNVDDVISRLGQMDIQNGIYQEGVKELKEVVQYIRSFDVPESYYAIDLTIARGLDYYTGTVYETILNQYQSIGSVCSGGRYDNLAENYTNRKLPGVGISIGLSRLFYQLTQAGIIKTEGESSPTKLLLIPMEGFQGYAINLATKVRKEGIAAEVFLNEGKLGKKIGYADKLGIPYVIVIGEDEANKNIFKLKNMTTGEQSDVHIENLIDILKEDRK